MYISEHFNLSKGHNNFDFVDIDIATDKELFIDPCLIESNATDFCREALSTINDYFDSFYKLYRNDSTVVDKIRLFRHAHEINATRLGYGSGNNGKAKTANGMIETFQSIKYLIDSRVPMSKAIDLNVFVPNFAEVCLSDMLTNILFLQLSKFTLEQCEKYSVRTQPVTKTYHYWNTATHNWEIYRGNGLYINDSLVLLVPKNIVRHNFYYNVDQYFRMVILEKMKAEQTTYDDNGREYAPTKKQLRETLLKSHSDVLHISANETINNPNLLDEHHRKLSFAYQDRGLSDSELDYWTYAHQILIA